MPSRSTVRNSSTAATTGGLRGTTNFKGHILKLKMTIG
uniref:Uncharacterized protein n=1 Tax=Rhizophora mucronata TaxID=61149 RepID=A0A2P2KUV2_RHIMU